MQIQFDPAKNVVNRAKHDISLGEAARLDWDTAFVWVDNRFDYGEMRMAGSDPDCPILTDEEWERVKLTGWVGARPVGRPKLEAPRPKVTLRMEPDVLAHLRASGKGWQTRVNALLREAVQAGRV